MKLQNILFACVVVLSPAVACAHFPFLHWTTLNDAPVLQVYFAESPEPDNPEFLDRLVDGKTWMKPVEGPVKDIEIKREQEFLLARPKVNDPVVFGFSKEWGEISRGDETFQLFYYAKTYSDRAAWKIDTSEELALDIRPAYKDGTLTVTALWKGKPLADAEIVVQGGLEHFEGKTDAKGEFSCALPDPALYAIRVRHVEDPGAGKKGPGRRHYATATIELDYKK